MLKVLLIVVSMFVLFNGGMRYYDSTKAVNLKQLGADVDREDIRAVRTQHFATNQLFWLGNVTIGILGLCLVCVKARQMKLLAVAVLALMAPGCRRPFEPVKLQTINPFEEAFLIPWNDAVKNQEQSHTEEFLKENMVYSQQVRIPQQWVPMGYETIFWNGEWKDAAVLITVDKSPVTKEWTADPNTGTSNKNEAVWVMTSDQVEFSTGWTCTARIASREDSIKFLANYPNGTLSQVMDKEIRGKLQSTFGLEVTDLPMDELRKHATPHIVAVVKEVEDYFKQRGVQITNLGITGGFVYKDPKIIETLVKLFNAEQEKQIATQEAAALFTKTEAEAKAILQKKKAEAEGIELVAKAKKFEIETAQADHEMYMALKEIELNNKKIERWDGTFPQYFIGGTGQGLDLMLQVPSLTHKAAKKPESPKPEPATKASTAPAVLPVN